MGIVLAALFIWASMIGINDEPSHYYVSPLTFGLGIASAVIAAISYFIKAESFRVASAFSAYCLLIGSISLLVINTGVANSPFLALWLIAALFVGAFGKTALIGLFIVVNAYNLYLVTDGGYAREMLVSIILITELPIIISWILWHENTKTQNKKDRAYFDLANQLNQVSNKSDVVIGAISDGVIAVNDNSVIELINPAAQRIVGWGHQDAVGLSYRSVLQLLSKDGHELDKSNDPVFGVLSNNQPVKRTDLQVQTNSGKKITVEIVVSPIGRAGSGAIIVFRDVTKEQEEERAQAEFISTASHEMRTPVASIEGYLGLALNPATATIDDKARDFIGKAHESAQHLGRLFQDLLDVTKADDGRLSNNPKVINVVDFTNTIIEGLQPKAEAKNLRIFFKAAPPDNIDTDPHGIRNIAPVFYVDLDADHLREVLSNLVENAVKYTPAGEVVVDVQGDDDHVVISIADSGIGIPTEDIPHLFQKFYRVDNSDTREIGGTGLGLYLCRRLTETMGGRIWVESEYKKGSTFYVELPRISHEEANRLIEAAATTPEQTHQDKAYSVSVSSRASIQGVRTSTQAAPQSQAAPVALSHASMSTSHQPATVAPAVQSQPVPVPTPPQTAPAQKPAAAPLQPQVTTVTPTTRAAPTPPTMTPVAQPQAPTQQAIVAPPQPMPIQSQPQPLVVPGRQ